MADGCLQDEGDVPPLEDMTEVISKLSSLQGLKDTQITKDVHPEGPRTETNRTEAALKPAAKTKAEHIEPPEYPVNVKDTNSFGGMKKGFLFGGPPKIKKKTVAKSEPPIEDIPYIKPQNTKEKEYELPEVQQAMQAGQAFLQNKDWVTNDLLTKITKSPGLSRRLADPSFMAAVTEFQTNPTAAMEKYKNNEEMQSFLKEFCGLMGEHFSRLGAEEEKQATVKTQEEGRIRTLEESGGGADLWVRNSTNPKQATAADEQRMQEILADPEIRAILMEPRIQKLFETLRSNPEQAQRELFDMEPNHRSSIQKLIEAGLLQIQR